MRIVHGTAAIGLACALAGSLVSYSARAVVAGQEGGPEAGSTLMVLNARIGVEGFYARFGYRAVGEPFDENTVPHIKMTKQLRP